MKILAMVVTGLGLVLILWAGVMAWQRHEALGRFGVSYVKTGSGAAEHVQFYCRQDGREVAGPEITGPHLGIMYQYINGNEAPEIIVYDKTYEPHHAILKIVLNDPKRPMLRVIEPYGIKITYPTH